MAMGYGNGYGQQNNPRGAVERTPLTDKQGNILPQVSLLSRLRGAWDGFWGPGEPLPGTLEQHPSEEGAPRERVYGPGQNRHITPRSEEPDRTPFDQLRSLATNYDVAQLCHQKLRQELAALDWKIAPVDSADPDAKTRLKSQAKEVEEFIKKPDGTFYLDQWAPLLLTEDLEIGAPVVYKHPTRGGQLGALEIIQGDTIKPVIDYRGKVLAYQQIYRGIPLNIWPATSIIYSPRIRRRSSAYGISPLELIVLTVNRALRKETFDLSYYTEGNIPESLAAPNRWPGCLRPGRPTR
jgi:hypothetical protein